MTNGSLAYQTFVKKNGQVPALYLDLFCCKNIAVQSHCSIFAYYHITYNSIHNYYIITVQNKSGYRAGTRPYVFRAKVWLHPAIAHLLVLCVRPDQTQCESFSVPLPLKVLGLAWQQGYSFSSHWYQQRPSILLLCFDTVIQNHECFLDFLFFG